MTPQKRNPPGLAPGRVSEEDNGLYLDTLNIPQAQSDDKPELPTDLKGMTVLAASVLHLQELICELEDKLMGMHHLISAQTKILKAFGDLYEELTDESERRKFLSKAVLKAEREAARLRLPLWFWRPESELDLKIQVYRRAEFLIREQKSNLDDTFDLLREFVDDCARPEIPVTDEQIAGVIEYAHRKEVN